MSRNRWGVDEHGRPASFTWKDWAMATVFVVCVIIASLALRSS